MIGLFLGWGIGPTLVASPDQESKKLNSKSSKAIGASSFEAQGLVKYASDSGEPVGKFKRQIDPVSGIRQASISATLLAGLLGIVATTVAQRVGHVPLPRGLGL